MSGLSRYMWFGAVLIVLYAVAQYAKPEPTNWSPSYLSTDKIPFGTYILRQQISDVFPNATIQMVDHEFQKNVAKTTSGLSNYMMIGSTVSIGPEDYRHMVDFMQKGNHILIAAGEIKGVLLDTLGIEIGLEPLFRKRRKKSINFVHPDLRREYDYYFDKGIGDHFFSKLDSARTVVVGKREGRDANFIKVKFGGGALFILPNPQLLTNYSLLKEDGRDYAAKLLSCLPKAGNFIWDEHFARPEEQRRSILRVFFEYEELRWAYYIALCSLLIFVVFAMKRRQRIIPIIERPKNTTVEFVSVVGRVYYQQRDNRDIAEKKVLYLLAYIRAKYRLKTSELDEEFESSLAKVSGAREETVAALILEIVYLNAGNPVTDEQLIRLNHIIEQFYQQDQ